MLISESGLEARFAANRYPRGGVAPLRYELALHEHGERRRQSAERNHAVDAAGPICKVMTFVVRLATALAGRSITTRSRHFRLSR